MADQVPAMNVLNKSSSPAQQKAALSACVAQRVQNGMDQSQAVQECSAAVSAQLGAATIVPEQGFLG